MDNFETYRTLLLSIAYRMTGSASEAEDIVQEAYLRYSTDASEIHSLKSYLSAIVTHLCLDYLKSARVKREQYIGEWIPEPILTTATEMVPLETVEQRESISLAFLILLETLNPLERAIFLLHEVFDYPFQEIANILDKTPANCRQIFHRAKQAITERRTRFEPSSKQQEMLLASFLAATQSGNLPALTNLLAQDIICWSDGGGKTRAAINPIVGQRAVARYWLGLARKAQQRNLSITQEEINGSPALLLWEDEALLLVFTLDADQNGIQKIYTILNPDKLAYIQRQLVARQSRPQP